MGLLQVMLRLLEIAAEHLKVGMAHE